MSPEPCPPSFIPQHTTPPRTTPHQPTPLPTRTPTHPHTPPPQELSGHTDAVLGVCAHPTLRILASGGTDKDLHNIRIWADETGMHKPEASQPPAPAPAPELKPAPAPKPPPAPPATEPAPAPPAVAAPPAGVVSAEGGEPPAKVARVE
jgi:hypothetical protein